MAFCIFNILCQLQGLILDKECDCMKKANSGGGLFVGGALGFVRYALFVGDNCGIIRQIFRQIADRNDPGQLTGMTETMEIGVSKFALGAK